MGRLWVAETESGLLVVALNSRSETALELALEMTEQLVDSVALTAMPC